MWYHAILCVYCHIHMSEYPYDYTAMFICLNIHTTLGVLSIYKQQRLEQPTSNIVYKLQYSRVWISIRHCALLPRYQRQNAESQHAQRMSDYSYDIQQCFVYIAILMCQNIHMILCNTAKDTKTKCWKPTCTVDDVKGDMKLFDDVWEVCVCVWSRACVCVCSVKDAKWVCCTCVCVCTCAGAHKSRNKYVRVLCVLSARGRPALICGKINISTCQPLITRLCPFFDYMRFAHTHRPTYPPTHAPTRPPTHSPTQPPTHACVCTHAHSAYADGTEE